MMSSEKPAFIGRLSHSIWTPLARLCLFPVAPVLHVVDLDLHVHACTDVLQKVIGAALLLKRLYDSTVILPTHVGDDMSLFLIICGGFVATSISFSSSDLSTFPRHACSDFEGDDF